MAGEPDIFVLPSDYTFAPNDLVIHKDSYDRATKLFEQANNRNPDRHDMYIYNDYFGYALLDLVDNTLSTIHTYVTKKKWLDAWHALDALSKFNDTFGEWTQIDDGERVRLTEKAYGAMLVTTIRVLDAEGSFNEEAIPDLAYTLGDMVRWGSMFAKQLFCHYHEVLQAYGKKLFGTRTDEEWARLAAIRKVACEKFVEKLSPEEREKRGFNYIERAKAKDDEDEDDDDEEDKKTWYDDGDVEDINMKDSTFRVTPTWKAYKDYLRECPRAPFYGPGIWDLTDWTKDERQQFSLDRFK